MSPKAEILSRMRENLDECKAYKVKKLGLFGSYVRAGQSPGSDVDILVEFEMGGKTFDNYMNLKFYLERLFHKKVDLVIKDALKPRIKNKVLSEVRYA